MIIGYKCFDIGLVNRYGMKFNIGVKYHASNEIRYHDNGFHMCANLEDTLRYFDAMKGEVEIAKVIGFGSIDKHDDEYNGFYDMYAVEYIQILHVLSREEIIEYALNLPIDRVQRFISFYRLTKDEIALFKEKYNVSAILMAIEYYQENNEKVYQKI